MTTRILAITLAAVACCLCSCQSTLPADSAISGTTGKATVAVAVGGLTWKDALRKVGLSIVEAGGQAVADYAVATLKGKLEQPSSK